MALETIGSFESRAQNTFEQLKAEKRVELYEDSPDDGTAVDISDEAILARRGNRSFLLGTEERDGTYVQVLVVHVQESVGRFLLAMRALLNDLPQSYVDDRGEDYTGSFTGSAAFEVGIIQDGMFGTSGPVLEATVDPDLRLLLRSKTDHRTTSMVLTDKPQLNYERLVRAVWAITGVGDLEELAPDVGCRICEGSGEVGMGRDTVGECSCLPAVVTLVPQAKEKPVCSLCKGDETVPDLSPNAWEGTTIPCPRCQNGRLGSRH